jgi:hypothetical protein
MHDTSKARSRVIGILLLWATIFAASFVVPLFIPVTLEMLAIAALIVRIVY